MTELDYGFLDPNEATMADLIADECDALKAMLLGKNKSYGNSAAEPLRVFSRVDPVEQINVRIDDKLSRIAKGCEFEGEDTEWDLIGYLLLKRCVQRHRKLNGQAASLKTSESK
ncbi:MAG: hypothetical protein ACOWWM_09620 [Desulfobacterales bacterium]